MMDSGVLEKMNLQRVVLAKRLVEQREVLAMQMPEWVKFCVHLEQSTDLGWNQRRVMRGMAYSMALCYRMCVHVAQSFDDGAMRLSAEQTDDVRTMRPEDVYLRQAEDITMERFLVSIDYFDDLSLEIYEGRYEDIIEQALNPDTPVSGEPVLQSVLLTFFTRMRHLSNAFTVLYNDKIIAALYGQYFDASRSDYQQAVSGLLRCLKESTDIPPSLMGQAFLENEPWKLVDENASLHGLSTEVLLDDSALSAL